MGATGGNTILHTLRMVLRTLGIYRGHGIWGNPVSLQSCVQGRYCHDGDIR